MNTVQFLRIVSLCVLVLSALLDVFVLKWLTRPEVQLILSVLIVMILLTYDLLIGIALAIALIVAYYRVNLDILGISSLWNNKNTKYYEGDMKGLVQKYITPQHLESAQNNVIDKKNAAIEMKGIKGVYGEPVYGAQGMDASMPGYEPTIGEAVAF
jgi:hypothetical protein